MLDQTQAREILEKRPNRSKISEIISYEGRVRLHTETALSLADTGQAGRELLNWVSTQIPPDKFKRFKELMRFPIDTVEQTERAYQALEKVLDGRNPVTEYVFTDRKIEQEAVDYYATLGGQSKFKRDAFDAMKLKPNCLVVIDFPAEQIGAIPEPYYYFLNFNSVLSFDETDGVIEWVLFEQPDDMVALFCDQYYRVYKVKDRDYSKATLVSEEEHEFDMCPAQFLLKNAAVSSKPYLKKGPITNQLGALDWLAMACVFEKHSDLSNGNPITWAFTQSCDYEREEEDGFEYCDRGYLRNDKVGFIHQGQNLKPCPACSKSKFSGAGSLIEVSPPEVDDEGNLPPLLTPPAGYVDRDKGLLEYNTEKVQQKKHEFYTSVVGYGGDPDNNQAINEKQVTSSYESKSAILNTIARDLEAAERWLLRLIFSVRYQSSFNDVSISLGTEFYLEEAKDILNQLNESKKESTPSSILDSTEIQYYETKYRNNPEALDRSILITHLTPFRHISNDTVISLFDKGVVAYEDLILKINLSSLINRFERENVPIVEFGVLLDFDKRVEKIIDTIRSYIEEPEKEDSQQVDVKQKMDAYGVGVRGGAITPQLEDENHFRNLLGIPNAGKEVAGAWSEDNGVRRPITLLAESAPSTGGFGAKEAPVLDE